MFVKDLRIGVLLDFYGDMLSERQRDILDMYYNDDLSLNEVAENLGISRQGVRAAVKKGEAILLDFENNLGLAERFRILEEKFNTIAAEIEAASEKYKDPALVEIAGQIRALSRYS